MKLLITSPWLHPYLEELRAEFPSVEFLTGDTTAELVAAAPDVEVMFGSVSEELLRSAESLRWIQSGSAGVEWMRGAPSLVDTDIIVSNTRGAHATTIAEHTIGMLVFLARGFDALYDAQKEHVWDGRRGRPRTGLLGLTMGIIGLGNLGRAIAVRAKAFEMKIIAVDAHAISVPEYVSQFWQLDGLPELLRQADVVVVTVPITPETRGMLGPKELGMMKDGAFLLVVSRGGIIDEPTVIQMLKDGKLTACGLDVTATEPLPADDPLWDAPNIFITPHNSPSSTQTRDNVVSILKENLTRYLKGEAVTNVVDKKLGY